MENNVFDKPMLTSNANQSLNIIEKILQNQTPSVTLSQMNHAVNSHIFSRISQSATHLAIADYIKEKI